MKIYHQSVFEKWQIADCSVQALITSPPYYSLRKYNIPDVIIGGDKNCKHEFELSEKKTGQSHWNQGGKVIPQHNRIIRDGGIVQQGFCIHCSAWKGQYGLEPDYKLYLAHTKLWMQEAIRVVKDDGVIFVNLADSYSGSNCGSNDYTSLNRYKPESYQEMYKGQKTGKQDVKPKSKLLIPERFSIMCVDELGLIVRNHIVWAKSNGMPESVTDRFSKKWESIFMFVKQPKYYFNLDDVREKQQTMEAENRPHGVERNRLYNYQGKYSKHSDREYTGRWGDDGNSMAMPEKWNNPKGKNPGDVWSIPTQPSPEKHFAMWPEKLVERMILCSTKIDDTVLDPFCGSGTTGRVALQYNRKFIGIDLGYSDIQQRRTSNIQKKLRM